MIKQLVRTSVCAALIFVGACSSKSETDKKAAQPTTTAAPSTPAKTATPATTSTPAANSTPATTAKPETKPEAKPETKPAATTPASTPAATAAPRVKLSTSMGDIVVELDPVKAPISTTNFLKYVDKGFYNGLIFHRIISNFMIQGGGFDADMQQKATDAPIKNEWQNGLKNDIYTIAMARTNVPDSGTSQFYINVVNNPMLDQPRGGAAYAVFGHVVSGQDVVDKIKMVPTGMKNGMGDVPLTPVVINKAERVTAAQPATKPETKPVDKNPEK